MLERPPSRQLKRQRRREANRRSAARHRQHVLAGGHRDARTMISVVVALAMALSLPLLKAAKPLEALIA